MFTPLYLHGLSYVVRLHSKGLWAVCRQQLVQTVFSQCYGLACFTHPVSVHTHSHARMYLSVHEHKESRCPHWVYSSMFSTLIYLSQGLSFNLELAVLASLAGQWAPAVHLSYPTMPWSQTDVGTPDFYVGTGIWTQVLMLASQAFTHRFISPAPWSCSEIVL